MQGLPVVTDWRWPFFTVDVELTNICGQNCAFCPRSMLTRPPGFIELEFLKKLLLQLASIKSRVTFCGMGNPLLHPQLKEILLFCRSISGLNFGLTVQAPALGARELDILGETRPGFLEISFPTIDPLLFSQIFPDQKFDDSLENVKQLIKISPPMRGLTIIAVRTAGEKISSQDTLNFWTEKGLTCRITECHSRGGNLPDSGLVTTIGCKKICCGLFAAHSFITWQGRLLSCCHDLSGTTELADLNIQSLEEAGLKKLEILRESMPFSICQNCDEPAAARPMPEGPYPEKPAERKKILRKL
ncbi:MAG: radical SAM/SPASM domain-containing protein [Candidatus Rifleibacteriota bacterium]